MTHEQITNGLLQLGFKSGWVLNGNQITVWENSQPQPNEKDILDASKLWDKTQQAEAEEKATAKAALLNKLGITAEEAQLLLGGN
jgi:hypothetical protein